MPKHHIMESKDCRHQRFKRTSFKKRDNKRELNSRLGHCSQRIEQAFKALFGDKYNDQAWLNTTEKFEMIKTEKNIPKAVRKARNFFKETPVQTITVP